MPLAQVADEPIDDGEQRAFVAATAHVLDEQPQVLPERRVQVRAHPRVQLELVGVGRLVQRDPAPQLIGRHAEGLFDLAQVGLDEVQLARGEWFFAEQRDVTGVVPNDREIVVERFRDELGDWRVCVLTPFGARVHAPWALATEARLHDRLAVEVQTMWSDDGFVLRLPESDEPPPLDELLPDPDEIEDLVVGQVANSALFAARFRENAARALLLPRRRPGSRVVYRGHARRTS